MYKDRFIEDSEPIKSKAKLIEFEHDLKNYGQSALSGLRMISIWRIGMTNLLRISDVIQLHFSQVINPDGTIKPFTVIHDQKTGKKNKLYFNDSEEVLEQYLQALKAKNIHSRWLFPNLSNPSKYVSRYACYKIIKKVSRYDGLKHISPHSCRKTGAYLMFTQSNRPDRLARIQNILNQGSSRVTLRYLGLDDKTDKSMRSHTKFY